jgi:capsular polysaccharide transport system ATP-binding protein
MIELIDLTKYYPTKLGPHYVFRNVNLVLPDDINVGVIGPNGGGKTTLLRLLAGVDIPNSGRVVRTGTISWPMGLTAGLQRTLTGRENARFACRIYGMPSYKIKAQLDKIQEISGVGKFFDLGVDTYSAGMMQRVSFAISISLGFDYYIFDEISAGGDLAFSKMAQTMMQDRLKTARFVVASHNLPEIRRLCKAVILMRNGTLTYFDDVEAGIEAYRQPAAGPKAMAAAEPVDEMRIEKLRQQYISLALDEKRLARLATQDADAGRKADVQRRLQNTRSLQQDVVLQFRLLKVALPKDEDIAGQEAAVASLPRPANPALARRIAQIRRQIDDLRAAETRQELNAQRADTKAKRADFLGRLEITRQRLAEREAELKQAEEETLANAEAKPLAAVATAATPIASAVQRDMLPAQKFNRQ